MSTTHSRVTASTPLLHIVAMISPPPRTAWVILAGELDLATAPELRERLLGVLSANHPAVLDIDLAGVTFLDCTGIGTLVAVRNAAVHKGCQLRACHPQPFVRRVLEVTGLLEVLTVEPQSVPTDPQQTPGPVPTTVTAPRALMVAA